MYVREIGQLLAILEVEIYEMPGTLRAGQGAAINRERKEAEAKAAAEAEAPVEEKSTKATPKRARKETE